MILFISIIVGFIALFIWAIFAAVKQSKENWGTLEKLKTKLKTLKNKEELEQFYEEFKTFANKIDNPYIKEELIKIDTHVRNLYKERDKYEKVFQYIDNRIKDLSDGSMKSLTEFSSDLNTINELIELKKFMENLVI